MIKAAGWCCDHRTGLIHAELFGQASDSDGPFGQKEWDKLVRHPGYVPLQ